MSMKIPTTLLLAALSINGVQGWVSNFPASRSSPVSLSMSASNIVLSPSEDPAAFDSFKLGSARVHRYSKDADPESKTEYIMWYHGRSQEMEGDSTTSLPSLSTGRIGRAVSKNGLIWEKQLTGSFSEDAPDVNLGLNKESWWGFDTAHVGLGNVVSRIQLQSRYLRYSCRMSDSLHFYGHAHQLNQPILTSSTTF
jgi:hypothetical protein